jgi:riboflavin transporter FmnP
MNNSSYKLLTTRKIAFAGLFLALGLVLPFLTLQNPALGNMLLLMHLPVLLCGFILGWPFGLVIGFATPLLRSLIFGMPPLYPVALAMAFELAAYGFATGMIYRLLPRKTPYIYINLIISMVFGRIIWGLATMTLLGIKGQALTWTMFLTSAFVNAVPGIILQIVLIPLLVIAFSKAGLTDGGTGKLKATI